MGHLTPFLRGWLRHCLYMYWIPTGGVQCRWSRPGKRKVTPVAPHSLKSFFRLSTKERVNLMFPQLCPSTTDRHTSSARASVVARKPSSDDSKSGTEAPPQRRLPDHLKKDPQSYLDRHCQFRPSPYRPRFPSAATPQRRRLANTGRDPDRWHLWKSHDGASQNRQENSHHLPSLSSEAIRRRSSFPFALSIVS